MRCGRAEPNQSSGFAKATDDDRVLFECLSQAFGGGLVDPENQQTGFGRPVPAGADSFTGKTCPAAGAQLALQASLPSFVLFGGKRRRSGITGGQVRPRPASVIGQQQIELRVALVDMNSQAATRRVGAIRRAAIGVVKCPIHGGVGSGDGGLTRRYGNFGSMNRSRSSDSTRLRARGLSRSARVTIPRISPGRS